MIAWNGLIPRWGDYRLGWHGQKIYFPFSQLGPWAAFKKGWLSVGAEIIKDFP